MDVKGLAHIAHSLIAGGLVQNIPAAVIQGGTTPQQRLVTGTLANIAQRAAEAKITSSAITVIGTVVNLSNALTWYEVARQA